MTFVSASDFGSFALSPRTWGTPSRSSANYLFTDFAGLNTHIYEPLEAITSSATILGYPAETPLIGLDDAIILVEDFLSSSAHAATKGVDPAIWEMASGSEFTFMSLRQNVARTNKILGFGGGDVTTLPPRYISTVKSYGTPITVAFRYCQGLYESGSIPPLWRGYGLALPAANEETLNFLYSADGGETWITQSSVIPDASAGGDARIAAHLDPFFSVTASFNADHGDFLKFKWEQARYSDPDAFQSANWGLDNTTFTRPQNPQYLNRTFVPDVIVGSPPIYMAQAFNALILHRQGPYGWPSWKQIRIGNHPIVRHWKGNSRSTCGKHWNLYCQTTFENILPDAGFGVKTSPGWAIPPAVGDDVILVKPVTTCHRIHPVEINYPYKTTFLVDTLPNTGYTNDEDKPFEDSKYFTQLATLGIEFENDIPSDLGLELLTPQELTIGIDGTALGVLSTFYLDGALDNINNPVSGYVEGIYTALVFPAKINMYSTTVRGRSCFTNTFWKNSRQKRTQLGGTKFGDD